jgi:hypothetical protein
MNKFFITTIFIVFADLLFSQVELVPPSHPVYDYLKRMQLLNIINDYNSSVIPVSRQQIADYLKIIDERKAKINNLDKSILRDYMIEFEYDINKTVNSSYSLFKKFDVNEIFSDRKQKYLYNYIDSNSSFFFDINGFVSQRNSNGDSLGNHSISLAELGIRVRGTLFDALGFYLRMSNGQKVKGNQDDIDMSIKTYPKFGANTKYRYENNNFDTYEGYLRYSTKNEWLSLTAGKEALLTGFGYVDKLFLSDNTVPFSYLKIDLKYKSLHYYYLYGSLKGDSLGIDIRAKNIAAHRLNVDFSNAFKLGFFESIIVSESPFNFTYLNPLSFLRSADYNAGELIGGNRNNAIMGFDMELHPVRKLAFQASLLIDDLNFSTLFNGNNKNGGIGNDNRFGYQLGSIWTDAFTVPDLTATLEYTRLDPFVYTHRTNKSQYTNWDLPLGHNLSPNADEIAIKLSSYIYNRLNMKFTYQHQRTANRLVLHGDTLIENYGGNINRGDGDIVRENNFLSGDRTDRDIFTFDFIWQPLRQYFLEFKYQYKISNLLYASKKEKDAYFFLTARVDF